MSSLEGVKPGDAIIACTGYSTTRTLTVTKVGRVWVYANGSGDAAGWQEKYRISDGRAPEAGWAMTLADHAEQERRDAVVKRLRGLGLVLHGAAGNALSTGLLTAVCGLIQRYGEESAKEGA